MRRLFSILLISCFLLGCGLLRTTPTSEVEDFFSKYQQLDNEVLTQLDDIIDDDNTLTTAQKDAYKTAIKRQYRDLTYEIKDEVIDGDEAIVTVEIEVYDLFRTTQSASQYLADNPDEFVDDDNLYDEGRFIDYRIEQMSDETEKIKYTLNLSLTKEDKKWVLDGISETDREKIHGLYNYS